MKKKKRSGERNGIGSLRSEVLRVLTRQDVALAQGGSGEGSMANDDTCGGPISVSRQKK